MSFTISAIIDHWITEFDLQAIRDILLESLSVIAFIFMLVVVIIAMAKSPILNKHGSLEMFAFVIFGLVYSAMNVLDEFIWFTNEAYDYWKLSKDLILLVGALILVIGFFRFFMFSKRLFGNVSIDQNPNEDRFKDQM